MAPHLGSVELREVTLEVFEPFCSLEDNIGRHGVEEGSVVGYDENSSRPRLEIVFQPCQGVQVDVIGRFVQHEEVGFDEQSTSKCQPHTPTTTEGFCWTVLIFFGEA